MFFVYDFRFYSSFYSKDLCLFSGLVRNGGMTYAGYLYNIIDSPPVNAKIRFINDDIGKSTSREVILSKESE